jgi:hypothetical protein
MSGRLDEIRPMNTDTSQRTHISLTAQERRALDAESAPMRRFLLSLIREVVETRHGTLRCSYDDLDLMRQSFDSWSDHDEDGASLVGKLR